MEGPRDLKTQKNRLPLSALIYERSASMKKLFALLLSSLFLTLLLIGAGIGLINKEKRLDEYRNRIDDLCMEEAEGIWQNVELYCESGREDDYRAAYGHFHMFGALVRDTSYDQLSIADKCDTLEGSFLRHQLTSKSLRCIADGFKALVNEKDFAQLNSSLSEALENEGK